jgi:hypothetical protein
MKYAIIENDLVVNIIEAEPEFIEAHALNAVTYTDEASIGATYKDGIFTPAAFVIIEEVTE